MLVLVVGRHRVIVLVLKPQVCRGSTPVLRGSWRPVQTACRPRRAGKTGDRGVDPEWEVLLRYGGCARLPSRVLPSYYGLLACL